jgi:hypothetical protein
MAHGLDVCEVSVTVPFIAMEPWLGSIIGSEPNTVVDMMAHVTHECRQPKQSNSPRAPAPVVNQ